MSRPVRIAFVMEIGLGHTTFAQNVRAALSACPDIEPVWIPITFDGPELLARLPRLRHDIVLRAGVQARQKLGRALHENKPDAVLFHTQMPAVFCAGVMRRVPGAVSLDATPKQFLRMGAWYGLTQNEHSPAERLRDRWYRQAFGAARRIFPWSEWAASSLVADYGVNREKIHVSAPGVNLSLWRPAPKEDRDDVRFLFVGGDFRRKGGDLLLRWMETAPPSVRLNMVTKNAPEHVPPRVRIHSNLNTNDPELTELYRQADVFVMPTRADCFGLVLMEAMGCGLPVVATRVAAIPEIVQDGHTGFVVEPDDFDALSARLNTLSANRTLRREMGAAGRARAEAHFDGAHAIAGEIDALRRLALAGRVEGAAQ